MAQKKLLFILIIVWGVGLDAIGFEAKGEALGEVQEMYNNPREAALNELKNILAKNKNIPEARDAIKSFKAQKQIYVFVSTSMPKSLLKSYYVEASRYGATLVFNGLPGESFIHLSKFITELHDSVNSKSGVSSRSKFNKEEKRKEKTIETAVIIDDESFKRFSITSVPSIVLYKEQNCLSERGCEVIYDKILGNIGIRKALEEFSESGDLRNHARELLQ